MKRTVSQVAIERTLDSMSSTCNANPSASPRLQGGGMAVELIDATVAHRPTRIAVKVVLVGLVGLLLVTRGRAVPGVRTSERDAAVARAAVNLAIPLARSAIVEALDVWLSTEGEEVA